MKKKIEGDLRQVLKPYLGHWDVPEDGDLILTIDEIYEEEIKNQHGTEIKPVIYFKEPDAKPMIVNKVNNDMITKVLGKRTKSNSWSGKKIALYEAPEPKSQDGLALRVRDYAPKTDEPLFCEECGAEITDYEADGKRFTAKGIATRSERTFGRRLCYECAAKAKQEQEATDE